MKSLTISAVRTAGAKPRAPGHVAADVPVEPVEEPPVWDTRDHQRTSGNAFAGASSRLANPLDSLPPPDLPDAPPPEPLEVEIVDTTRETTRIYGVDAATGAQRTDVYIDVDRITSLTTRDNRTGRLMRQTIPWGS